MRCRVVAFLIAFVPYALPGLPALAIPPIDFCEKNPDSPLCDPVDPDPDPDPDPVDPCLEDPASCPVDPEPEPEPCELDPVSCEPQPEPEPEPDTAFFGTLHGALRVKTGGQRAKDEGPVTLVLRGADVDMLSQSTCLAFEGAMEPTKRPAKAEIFLDDPSELTFAALVAVVVGEATGENTGETIGANLKITLKGDPSGPAMLKIKGSVLFARIGKVAVKAKYVGTMDSGALPEVPTCM